MNKISLNDKLKLLEKKYDFIEKFKYKNSSAWINIKNLLYMKGIKIYFPFIFKQKNIKLTIYFLGLSFINFIKGFKKKELFVGAASGIMKFENNFIDIYFPEKLANRKDLLYFVSFDDLDRMYEYKHYFLNNNIIVYNFIFSPVKIFIAKLIKNFISLDSNTMKILKEIGIENIGEHEIKYHYAKFVAGYWIYKLIFMFVKIKKVYIVSAYSNTELIAALKEKGIEIIEIQHGLVGVTHRGYNYVVKSKLLPTPNKILVYNQFWKKELLEAGYYEDNQIEIFDRFQYKMIKSDLSLFDKNFIVFTGQGIFLNKIEEFIKNSLTYLKEKNLYLIYLPHPMEKKTITINSEYVKILKNKEYLTEQYIYSSIAHISIYSSCHFDAIHFHDKTYILDIMDDNPLKYYVDKYPDKFKLIKKLEEIEI